MKSSIVKKSVGKKFFAASLIIMAGIFMFSLMECQSKDEKENEVKKAFDLRMQGKVDQALALVDSILAADSTNAMAYFERARILNYKMIGGANVSMKDVMYASSKALFYDEDNINYAYAKAINTFLNAYIVMETEKGNIKDEVEKTCNAFENMLEINPDDKVALLYLVDIYSQLPAEMGGDSAKAVYYADRLKNIDDHYYAKADLLLNPQNETNYWLGYLDNHEKTPEVLKDLGVAYIYQEDPENSIKYFNEAIVMDPSFNTLYLDQARYYMFLVMQGMTEPDSVLPVAAKYINLYLDSDPKPVIPMEAYALGMLVKTKMFTGQKEEGRKLMEKAKELDPYFSRAFGIPGAFQFQAPDKLNPQFSSFFRPF